MLRAKSETDGKYVNGSIQWHLQQEHTQEKDENAPCVKSGLPIARKISLGAPHLGNLL
jgi:hypothetical protein